MKNLINKMIFGKNANLSLLAVLGILIFIVLGCKGLGRKEANVISTNSSPSATSTPAASTPKPSFVKADASKAEMPSDDELQEIVKTTLLDFDSAVDDADFTDFYDNISRAWKKQTSPSELKTSFQGFIDKKISISKIKSMDAVFSPEPVIEKELGYKTLKLEGRYKTSPNSTKFLLHYIPDGKDWKLSRIEVDTTAD
jgi:hypothetical protein